MYIYIYTHARGVLIVLYSYNSEQVGHAREPPAKLADAHVSFVVGSNANIGYWVQGRFSYCIQSVVGNGIGYLSEFLFICMHCVH